MSSAEGFLFTKNAGIVNTTPSGSLYFLVFAANSNGTRI
jgi:hypothetical protein